MTLPAAPPALPEGPRTHDLAPHGPCGSPRCRVPTPPHPGPPSGTAPSSSPVRSLVAALSSPRSLLQPGKIRALAVPTAQRPPLLPDIPPYAEAGFQTPPDFSGWWALTSPAGVANEILDRMNTEVTAILRTSEVRDMLLKRGITAIPSTREEATPHQREQLQAWTKMIAETRLKG